MTALVRKGAKEMCGGRSFKACLIIVFLLGMAGLAQARTITVGPGPGYDFNSIQPAIDDYAAWSGEPVFASSVERKLPEIYKHSLQRQLILF